MNNLVCVRLAGGLGNQLFQVAAAALFMQQGFRVMLMTGGLSKYSSPRNFDLDRLFNFSTLNMSVNEGPSFLKICVERLRLGRFPIIGLNDRNIKNIVMPPKSKFLFMDGYFQDFWSDREIQQSFDELASHINFKSIAEDGNTCVIHIRGGDFLRSQTFNVVPISWYVFKAKFILEKHHISRFCIVSDDAEVARSLLSELNLNFNLPTFIKESRDFIEDFNAIRTASYRLIGNSTFALSAAALAGNRGITFASRNFDKNRVRNWRLSTEIYDFFD